MQIRRDQQPHQQQALLWVRDRARRFPSHQPTPVHSFRKLTKNMTLPKLLVVIWWCASGFLMGAVWHEHLGVIGACAGFLLGFTGALLLSLGIGWALWKLFGFLFSFPPCRRGTCLQYSDYMWRRGTFFGWEKWRKWLFRCRCGDLYIFDGNRFFEVLPDNALRPYKRLSGFRKWDNDGNRGHSS